MTALGEALVPLDGRPDDAFFDSLAEATAAAGVPVPEAAQVAALASVAAVSPFLKDLMLRDPAMLNEVLAASLDESVRRACSEAGDTDRALRLGKRRVALAVALADLCADASVEVVTAALSRFADHAVQTALAAVLAEAHAAGQATSPDVGASGIVVLAMGKLGGAELNYSSDIDLVVLFDPSRAGDVGLSPERITRLTQRMVALLQNRDADGYVFRVDLRLRPDPGATPVAVSTETTIRYFQARARAWERQAMIKARQVAGDAIAGKHYLDAIEASIWHTGYDFGEVDEAIALRDRTVALKGAGNMTAPGHNVKLGRGGIREIEFFVQALQRVAGGRDPALRGRATLPMLQLLCARGWIRPSDRDAMTAAYRFLRRVEHRLQMVNDAHVHTLPHTAGLGRIAIMMREPDFANVFRDLLETVHARVSAFWNGGMDANPLLASLSSVERDLAEATNELLAQKMAVWRSGRYQALRSQAAQFLLDTLKPSLAKALASTPDPDGAIAGLDDFFARLTRGADVLARLNRQPTLVPVITLIVSAAPRLAEQLARRAHLLDVLIDPAFYGHAPEEIALAQSLDGSLAAAESYEDALDILRVFGQEQMLLIEVRILTGSLNSGDAGAAISSVAQLLADRALHLAQREFEARHGKVEGEGVALLALGSIGGREMTPSSDLDIVFIYDAVDERGQSDGEKPLSPAHYYARLAQRFIASLSAPTSKGRLFDVDLRLRPAGRAGPLATHIRSFERYHAESAWVWEHMALTRARVICGSEVLGERAMEAIETAISGHEDVDALTKEVISMRRKLDEFAPNDAKHAPGGLIDIEFIAQYLRLRHGLATRSTSMRKLLEELAAVDVLDKNAAETLMEAYRVFRKLKLLFACAGVPADPETAPAALQPLLLRAADAPDITFLTADLDAKRTMVRQLFEDIIGPIDLAADAEPSG